MLKQKNGAILFGIIMAGGGGTRLWPYSTDEKPKQFLDLLGTGKSLLQDTFLRLNKLIPAEQILIVTNERYRELVMEQIPQIASSQILCEPMRRNTAPCIAYAVAHIMAQAKQEGCNAEDIAMVVAPSDHYIQNEDGFLQKLQTGFDFVLTHDSLLTLGIQPTHPHTGYGYIQKDVAQEKEIFKVKKFTEKPNKEVAEQFLQDGNYFWNAGIFLWSLTSVINAFQTHLPKLLSVFEDGLDQLNTAKEQAFIANVFPTCESISIDYGLLEKAANVYVLPASFGWNDLGAWEAIYELSKKDEHANATINGDVEYKDCSENLVLNTSGEKVRLENLHHTLVVHTQDGILVRLLN